MSTGDLTTLANVKQWMSLASSVDDALISRLITAQSSLIQQYLNRILPSADYVQVLDGKDNRVAMLSNYPVTAVSGIVIDGGAVPESTSANASGWVIGSDRTAVELRGYSFTRGSSNVEISYTAGFSIIPTEIEQACIELVQLRYVERTRAGVSSKTLGGETVSFKSSALPDAVLLTLRQHRKVIPV